MIKTLGALLILFGCISIGYLPISKMNLRIAQLNDYQEFLMKLHRELHTNAAPLPQLFSQLDISESSWAFALFEKIKGSLYTQQSISFRDAWKEHISKDELLFIAEERQCILMLGETLGKYTLEDELQAIENAASKLQEGIQTTKQKIQEIAKLSMGCSAAIGIMLILVLI